VQQALGHIDLRVRVFVIFFSYRMLNSTFIVSCKLCRKTNIFPLLFPISYCHECVYCRYCEKKVFLCALFVIAHRCKLCVCLCCVREMRKEGRKEEKTQNMQEHSHIFQLPYSTTKMNCLSLFVLHTFLIPLFIFMCMCLLWRFKKAWKFISVEMNMHMNNKNNAHTRVNAT
jgi:hypothetical protein